MAGPGEILRRTTELHKDSGLMDHFAGAEADDMDAQHAVARLVGEDLHKALGVEHGAGARAVPRGLLIGETPAVRWLISMVRSLESTL